MGEGPSPRLLDLISGAGHYLEYFGLLAAIGSFVVRRLGRFEPRIGWANPPMLSFLAVALAGGLLLLAVTHTWLVLVRVAVEVIAVALCARGRGFVAPPTVFAAAFLAVSGHAAAATPAAAGPELNDAVHVLSAALWAGGVIALATVRPPGGWRSADALSLLERFGRVAVIAFVVTALTGVLSATERLSSPSDLWTTAYGAWLALKVVSIGFMLLFSVLWRLKVTDGRPESGAAAIVVFVTAVLAVLTPPA